MRRRKQLVSSLLLLALAGGSTLLASACNENTCSYGGDCKAPPQRNAVVCDPWAAPPAEIDLRGGLRGTLTYFSGGDPGHSDSRYFVEHGTKKNAELYFNQLAVPATQFTEGFVSTRGVTLQTDTGHKLNEWFGLRLSSLLKLATAEEPGRYQLAILSDDGASVYVDDSNTGLSRIVDGEGRHTPRIACATRTVELRAESRLPLQVDYYQASSPQLALTLLWRKLPDGASLDSAICGSDTLPSAANAEGWKVLATANYELPPEVLANPCNDAGKTVQTESFPTFETKVHTSQSFRDVDLLWVIDNSKSMEPYQRKVTEGLVSIARNFFEGDRELRTGVITTDTWLLGTDLGPIGDCFARLLPGIHDGPVPAWPPINPDCSLRGALPAGHTGKPILSSRNGAGQSVDPVQLARDFQINATVGIGGNADERGLQSLDRFLRVNEERAVCGSGDKSCLFHPNTMRGIIFLSDEPSPGSLSFGGKTVDQEAAGSLADAQRPADLMRKRLNAFFQALDGSGASGDPSYFVASIVVGNALEYVALADLVRRDASNSAGVLSINADINLPDYAGLLTNIGRAINTYTELIQVTSFELPRAASKAKAYLVLADGTTTEIPDSAVHLNGSTVDVDAAALPDPLPTDSTIQISYVPR